ncbi:phosphonate C-P lyase system protein PhnH [Clavibacter sp. VKM Ac-2872]|uniref:phosphonate C-P lyase system protein PhnH n=1 Tax=Clavibacter sp. VKM Ac-2872 TaxID=2783812 RepID=UPI00188AD4D5|nr:phosphonate C-P lyase system protein PhnH [Clavibacter sp. VKM Ac-2872]
MSAETGRAPGIPAPGFPDPTRGAQAAFRALLDALAHPTRVHPIAGPTEAPAGLGAGLGAVALTVLDEESALWLDPRRAADAEVVSWLTFHTGVRIVADAADAVFVLADPASLPPLAELAAGTDEEPHRSATVLVDVRDASGSLRVRAEGPGIDGHAIADAPWADDAFLDAWRANGRRFPRGVDLLLVDAGSVAGLPRTTRLRAVDPRSEA